MIKEYSIFSNRAFLVIRLWRVGNSLGNSLLCLREQWDLFSSPFLIIKSLKNLEMCPFFCHWLSSNSWADSYLFISFLTRWRKLGLARCLRRSTWNTVRHIYTPSIPVARWERQENHREIYEWASLEYLEQQNWKINPASTRWKARTNFWTLSSALHMSTVAHGCLCAYAHTCTHLHAHICMHTNN